MPKKSISDRWQTKIIETSKCPICHHYLKNWGDIINYQDRTKTILWCCENPKCDYDREQIIPLE